MRSKSLGRRILKSRILYSTKVYIRYDDRTCSDIHELKKFTFHAHFLGNVTDGLSHYGGGGGLERKVTWEEPRNRGSNGNFINDYHSADLECVVDCVPENSYVGVLTPGVPQNVTLLGDRVFKEAIRLK